MAFTCKFELVGILVAHALVLASVVESASVMPHFASFISEYGRLYTRDTPEYEERRKIFEHSLAKVDAQNSNPNRLWNAALNHLSDRTEAELSALRGLRAMNMQKTSGGSAVGRHGSSKNFLHQIENVVVPENKSWSHLKSLQADTDQGGCGSCWAVATATMLAANAELKGHNHSFSAQELVSCSPNPHNCGGSGGCSGSTVELAMNWFVAKGLATKEETPYSGTDGSCAKDTSMPTSFISDDGKDDLAQMIHVGYHAASAGSVGRRLGLTGWTRLAENEYSPLLQAVATQGPVAISIEGQGLNNYGSGIYDGCSKDAVIDHAVVLMGYGKDKARNDKPYWLIKNSWGLSWGENGNYRMLRNTGNGYCGTDYQPEVGTGCDGGPSSVKVCGMCGILYDAVVAHFSDASL